MKQPKIETITNKIRHWQKLLQFATLLGVLVLGILANAPPALAWKPTTHVYLGQQALKDALDDGKVSIYRVDYKNGKVLSKIGDYPVDSNILSALKANPSQYRAGILGPDAYPDILTGQQVIHPDPGSTNIATGSNAWLTYLWTLTNTQGNNTLQHKAFVVGYLTHAAGDMYGHTFINNFSGAPFKITPPEGPENGVKHILLEGYIDKRLNKPELDSNFFNVSIAGVEDFIYRNMVDAKPGTPLDTYLLKKGGGGTEFSVPRIYSTLRARLQADIDAYYAKKADFDRRYDQKIQAANACKLLDFSCSATVLRAQALAIQAEKAAYVTANGLIVTYKEYWRADIDRGLKAWPQVSHEVAKALFFNPDRKAKVDDAERILKNYVTNHLISMSGAPDAVGQFAALAGKISDIIAQVIPDFLVAPIRELKNDIYNAIIKRATGMTKDQLKAYLENPERYFDQVFTRGSGEKVNLQTFNKKYLQINDTGYTNPNESFDYQKFPAAYNTVTMSKLILLNKDGVNKLLADLGSSSTKLNEANIMLGFIPSLDGSNQWFGGTGPLDSKQRMILAKSCSTYKQVFMQQAGEAPCP
jgi:hypothetical protein